MPISRSKSQRKTANRRTLHVNAQLRGAQRQLAQTARAAQQIYDERAFLAKVLTYVIAANGGELRLPKDKLKQLPEDARLQQMYDRESETFVFTTVVESADESPIVQPKVEIVPARMRA